MRLLSCAALAVVLVHASVVCGQTLQFTDVTAQAGLNAPFAFAMTGVPPDMLSMPAGGHAQHVGRDAGHRKGERGVQARLGRHVGELERLTADDGCVDKHNRQSGARQQPHDRILPHVGSARAGPRLKRTGPPHQPAEIPPRCFH